MHGTYPMTLVIDKKTQGQVARQLQKDIEGRLKKLSADALRDFVKLCEMLTDESQEEHKDEIARAITDMIFPDVPTGNEFADTEQDIADAKARVARYRQKVGKAISFRRNKLGMTQVQLAAETGLPQTHISRLEKGRHAPTYTTILKIAKALKARPASLDPGFSEDE